MVPSISVGRWRKPGARPLACTLMCWAALTTTALTAQAQVAAPGGTRAAKPDPLDTKAGVPELVYESSFSRYRRLDDSKPLSWREANDTVARIGGWRVYAREAQQPDTLPVVKPASPASAAASREMAKPMPAGHGGHKTP